MSGEPVLSHRALNRALLARQLLLERVPMGAAEAVDHLVGLQAQAPRAPYVALWSRLRGFEPASLEALVARRAYVRTHVMRYTIHLVSARDAIELRALLRPALDRRFASTPWAKALRAAGLSTEEVAAGAGDVLAAGAPRSRTQLAAELAPRWPEADPLALAYSVLTHVPAVQVPPRGLWRESGPVAWETTERFLGTGVPASPPAPDATVLRYLTAFGPATAADVRTWSGLTGIREVLDRLRGRLRAFRDEDGRELLDLPDAPRPDEDVPAPPRLLGEYDNVLLSHADRRRIMARDGIVPLPPGDGAATGPFLVDGMFAGTWRREDDAIELRPFAPLGDDEGPLREEAARLLAFIAPEAGAGEVRVAPPGA